MPRRFREGGWETVFGPDIAHDGSAPERASYREVVLVQRLARSLARLNPQVPSAVLDEAVQHVLKLDHPVAAQRNRDFHRLLLAGLPVSWREGDAVEHDELRLAQFSTQHLDTNEFLVITSSRSEVRTRPVGPISSSSSTACRSPSLS
ncbi:MAG: hypothetical protein LBG65_02275 [Puniceicoccales bacterium]|nr:hypothetical protein [Puniceicoccales bacterium]